MQDVTSFESYLASRESIKAIILPSILPRIVDEVPFVHAEFLFVRRYPENNTREALESTASALIRTNSIGSAVVVHPCGTFALICATPKAHGSTFCVFDPHCRGQYNGATFFLFSDINPAVQFLSSLLDPQSSRSEQPLQHHLSGELKVYNFTPKNPYSLDLAFLTQSVIQSGIENLALRSENEELARQLEVLNLRRARRKESRRLERAVSALGLDVGENACKPSPGSPDPRLELEGEVYPHIRSSTSARLLEPIELPLSPEVSSPDLEVECDKCMETYEETHILRVVPCGHAFCHDCLASHVRIKLDTRRYPVTCPRCPMSAEYTAHPSVIQEDILERLSLTDDHFAMLKELNRRGG